MAATAALILAAGKGTRMRSALPKVLHPLGGRPLLAHVLDTAAATAERTVVVVSPDAPEVASLARSADAECVEQAERLGTGDAVRRALPSLAGDDRVLVLCGDVPLLAVATARALLDATPAGALGLVTARVPDPSGLGRILRDDDGGVRAIVEERDATDAQRRIDEINAGIYVLPVPRLERWLARLSSANAQGEYYLTDLVAFAVDDGVTVHAHRVEDLDEIAGVNDRVQLARLERSWQRRCAETLLRAGVTLLDPARFDQRGTLHAGEDCVIDVGCVFEGTVRLGRNVRIGPHCVLRNVELGDDTVVEAFTHLEGARIGRGVQLGPFARLREGTELADGAKIGNFVETKKTRLGPGTKANHLAYLGDTTLGAGCNVGAGTITCNYDGTAKHPTTGGDGVFIGSNATLVAPLELGAGAYVAAGSTVTSRVPDAALAVGRARQRNIEGWTAPKDRGRRSDED
jgi:bifunctional UDP-N-acetylglucosamine pyrophosphorylase/glucosamine-1-phosphate N-acetyltransferase